MKSRSPDGEKPPGPNGSSPKALLGQILRDLADDPSDLGALLRGLALALQVASAECPTTRQVWNPQEREAYRSKVVWEAWILHQRHPRHRDLK